MSQGYHDFQEQLRYSQRQSDDPFWEEAYRKAFPDFAARQSVAHDLRYQKKGVDSIIHLVSGRKLYVDEKMRKKFYPDIALEYTHIYKDERGGFPGWMEKPELALDYLAYAMKPRICYVLPWQQLRKAWLQYKDDWLKMFTPFSAPNEDYMTYNLPIPTADLLKAVSGAMVINLKSVANPA